MRRRPQRSARRPARHRLLDRPRRAVLHDAARRPRCGRHQGRAARGRRRRAAGGRRGSGDGRRRRRAGTAAYYLAVNRNKRSLRLDLKTADGAEILRRLLAGARRPGRELPGRRRSPGSASTRRRCRRSTRGSSTSRSPATGRRARPRTGPATTSSIQATSGLMSITGAPGRRRWRADQGRGRDQRRRDRDARGGRGPGRARRSGARRTAPAAGRGQRVDVSLLGATLASLVNQAQNAFVEGRRAGPARQRPPEHRAVRDVRRRPTARSRSRSGRSASGRGCAWRSGCPSSPSDPRFATNGDRVERPRGAAADPGRAVPRARTTADWLARPGGGRDPGRADQRRRRRLRVARGGRARDDRRAGASGLGRHPPGRDPVPLSATPAVDPDAAADPRPGHRRDPRPSSATAADEIAGLRARRGRLRSPERRAQSSWRRNDQAASRAATTIRTTVEMTGVSDVARRRPARPPPARRAGPASPPGRNRPDVRDRPRRSTGRAAPRTRSPAAAAVEPVTVLARNVMAAQAARPSQARSAERDPAADRQRLEQDRGVDPADRDGQGDAGREHQPEARRPWRRGTSPRETRLRQDERGRAAIPFRGHGAHRQHDRRERPELGQVLPELVGRIGRDRGRDRDGRQLVAGGRRDDLGQEPREQRRGQADEQEQPGRRSAGASSATTRAAPCAARTRQAAHAAAPRRPARPAAGRRPRAIGRTRSNAASRRPAATTSGSSPADAAASSRDRHDEPPVAVAAGDAVDPRHAPASVAARPASAGLLAGLRLDPVERQRVRREQLVERPLGHQPAGGHDPDPVADPLDVGQDVGREDDRRARAQVRDEGEQVAPALRDRAS